MRINRPAERFTDYGYDAIGQVTQVRYSDATAENYSYDEAGTLIRAENDTSTVRPERDALGRVRRESAGEQWVEYGYDALSQRTKIRSSLGADIDLSHDTNGNVGEISSGSWQVRFGYDVRGLEVQRQFSGGVQLGWQRDAVGRPSQQRITAGGTTRQRTYAWTGNDLLTQIDGTQSGLTQYEHDRLGTLTRATFADGSQELRLPDAVGNLFETATKDDREYGPGGQLLRSEKATYQYDAEGNLTRKNTRNGDVWQYEWAGNGMLSQVIRPDGEPVAFTYDALGRRLSKTYKGRVTRWVWEGNKPLHEWQELVLDGQNTDEVITWLFEEDSFAPIGKLQGTTRQSILTDHLGTPLAMVDQGGSRRWAAHTTAYGRLRISEGTRAQCPFRFQGQYEDTETGLYYNRFRYYDPQEGGYISQDPIGLLGGKQFYQYVSDTNFYIDPSGLSCEITKKLQKHADDARAEAVLSPRQQASIQRSRDRAAKATDPKVKAYHEAYVGRKERLYMGTQVDTRFKAKVDADPELAHLSTTPRGKVGPDVYDPKDKKYWDLTTQKDWDKGSHQNKYDKDFGSGTGIFW